MTTITRYLLRAYAGPFAFAFVAVTGLLFLTAVAQRFQELAGKGVGGGVILELMLLSLPHVVTLAVPMALFAATQYVFADLSESGELVAMAAGGVHPGRLIAPLLVTGFVVSLLMVGFNDRILSAANARFQDRLEDVARMSPTLRLRAGAVNAVRTGDGAVRYVVVQSIDARSNVLRGVTIADLSRPSRPRYVTAESATVAVMPNRRDLALRLTHGTLASPYLDRPGTLVTSEFRGYLVRFRGLAARVERGARVEERAERELSMASLRQRIRNAECDGVDPARWGCRERSSAAAQARRSVVIRSLGEIHRRLATAFACVVLVLLAAPLGIRFAYGGIGAVIGLSVAVLLFFRVGIIWGDRLTDAGWIDPLLGSWATVGVLLLLTLPLLRDIGGAVANARTSADLVRGTQGDGMLRRRRAPGHAAARSRETP